MTKPRKVFKFYNILGEERYNSFVKLSSDTIDDGIGYCGQIEQADARISKLVQAFGRLCEELAQREILDEQTLLEIINPYSSLTIKKQKSL